MAPPAHAEHLKRAIDLACEAASSARGGPFGAVIVSPAGQIIGEGSNQVTSSCDPTAHAEVVAIRQACRTIGHFSLSGHTLYASCEPCPMCLAAAYWSRVRAIYYAAVAADAAAAGFDDAFFYQELGKTPSERAVPARRIALAGAGRPFALWSAQPDRIPY